MNRELSLETGRGRRWRSQSLTSETTSIFDCRPVVQLAELDRPSKMVPESRRTLHLKNRFPLLTRGIDLFVADSQLLLLNVSVLQRLFSRVNRAVRFYIQRTLVHVASAEECSMLRVSAILSSLSISGEYRALNIASSRMILEMSTKVVEHQSHSR